MRQRDGGPIRLRLSGSVAILVMVIWDSKMVKLMKENSLVMPLYRRYVDDGNGVLERFDRGWRWSDESGKMEWRDEWRVEEEEVDEPDDRRCFREWRRFCNSI